MYKRMNGFIALLVFMLMFLLLIPFANADQFGLGGAWVDGHSDSSEYGINNGGDQSWGLHFNYDKDMDWKKEFSVNNRIGVDMSMQLFYLHWTKQINEQHEEKDCYNGYCQPDYDPYDPDDPGSADAPPLTTHTVKTEHYTSVNSLIAAVGPKAYAKYGIATLYGMAGAGYALQDGAHDDLTVMGQIGLSLQFTKYFGISADHSEIFVSPTGEYDRFDVTSLNAVLFIPN